ncbi:MAG: SGNH/GDSL hydrolase family protein [Terrimicrobiaceae bacterium]
MKTILCYGDSNTWGFEPVTRNRYGRTERWTGILRQELGLDYDVIEEGLNGRTTVWDDPIEGHKNGKEQIIPILKSHQPLDLVTIMLGTNDLKRRFGLGALDIAEGAGALVEMVQKSDCGPGDGAPQVLLMAPPPVARLSEFAEMFEGAREKSRQFGRHYRRVAGERNCAFFDAGEVITSSDRDGIHFEIEEHRKLGLAVAAQIRELPQ